jgi:hypothetical protein
MFKKGASVQTKFFCPESPNVINFNYIHLNVITCSDDYQMDGENAIQ